MCLEPVKLHHPNISQECQESVRIPWFYPIITTLELYKSNPLYRSWAKPFKVANCVKSSNISKSWFTQYQIMLDPRSIQLDRWASLLCTCGICGWDGRKHTRVLPLGNHSHDVGLDSNFSLLGSYMFLYNAYHAWKKKQNIGQVRGK